MPRILLLAATSLVAAACTATSHHDGSRASIDHDLTRAALGDGPMPSTPATPGHAMPPRDVPLGADAAVAFAIANNPSFRAEVLTAHEAALALDAVALGPTPMVMLEVGVPISDMASVPVLALLTASLTDLVTRDDRLEAASLRAQAAHLAAIDAAATLAATVRERHAMAWQAQESLRLAQAAFALTQVEADRESALAARGMATARRDQAGAAALAGARANVEQARASEASALRALAASMGCALDDARWPIERPGLAPMPDRSILASSGETPAARLALALAAATRIEAGLVRSGLAQNANIGAGYMQDEEGMKAIPITLQFALPVGGEGATRDERADLLDEAARLRADAALQQAHVRLADALDREAGARIAAASLAAGPLDAARAQHDRLRVLATQGAATTKDRDQARLASIEAELDAVEAHATACVATAQRLAACAGIDLARSMDDDARASR